MQIRKGSRLTNRTAIFVCAVNPIGPKNNEYWNQTKLPTTTTERMTLIALEQQLPRMNDRFVFEKFRESASTRQLTMFTVGDCMIPDGGLCFFYYL
jgi:hypothetical protein